MCCFLSQPPSSIRGGGGSGYLPRRLQPRAGKLLLQRSWAPIVRDTSLAGICALDTAVRHVGLAFQVRTMGPTTRHTPGAPPVTDRIDNRARMVRLGNRADDSWLFLSSGVGLYRRDHVSPRAGPESGPMDGPLFFFVLHPQRGKVFSDSRASPVRRLISRPRSHLYCTPPQGI